MSQAPTAISVKVSLDAERVVAGPEQPAGDERRPAARRQERAVKTRDS